MPKWLKAYFSESDLKSIEQAVSQVELKTSGEVVPMVVRRSSTVGHVPIILLLLFGLLFFVFDVDHWQLSHFDLPHWLLILIDLVVVTVLVRLLSPLPWVERILTSQKDQAWQVEQRAMNEFYHHRIDDTEHATGILVFVSLLERRAVILGDHAISSKIDGDQWQQVVEKLIEGVKKKNLNLGFCEAIEASGEILSQHFPRASDDKNELKDHLIIKE